jgi:hypothetical protein
LYPPRTPMVPQRQLEAQDKLRGQPERGTVIFHAQALCLAAVSIHPQQRGREVVGLSPERKLFDRFDASSAVACKFHALRPGLLQQERIHGGCRAVRIVKQHFMGFTQRLTNVLRHSGPASPRSHPFPDFPSVEQPMKSRRLYRFAGPGRIRLRIHPDGCGFKTDRD